MAYAIAHTFVICMYLENLENLENTVKTTFFFGKLLENTGKLNAKNAVKTSFSYPDGVFRVFQRPEKRKMAF